MSNLTTETVHELVTDWAYEIRRELEHAEELARQLTERDLPQPMTKGLVGEQDMDMNFAAALTTLQDARHAMATALEEQS